MVRTTDTEYVTYTRTADTLSVAVTLPAVVVGRVDKVAILIERQPYGWSTTIYKNGRTVLVSAKDPSALRCFKAGVEAYCRHVGGSA